MLNSERSAPPVKAAVGNNPLARSRGSANASAHSEDRVRYDPRVFRFHVVTWRGSESKPSARSAGTEVRRQSRSQRDPPGRCGRAAGGGRDYEHLLSARLRPGGIFQRSRVEGRGDVEFARTGGAALAFSPIGQMLAMIGGGGSLTFWDVAVNRWRPTPELETEAFRVWSIAFSPEGRTLAAAGAMNDGKNGNEHGQVRLYDLAIEPFRRRAVLTFDGDGHAPGGVNRQDQVPFCSDVKFTPDGRRVVAVAMHKIRTWNASTGAETDAFERTSGGSSDGLSVSPDGRWMAVTSPVGAGVNIFDIVRCAVSSAPHQRIGHCWCGQTARWLTPRGPPARLARANRAAPKWKLSARAPFWVK
jgi:WD40 repeat protein